MDALAIEAFKHYAYSLELKQERNIDTKPDIKRY